MNEFMKLIKQSKTMKSGIVTIVWGILIFFGVVNPSPPPTIDDLGKKQDTTLLKLIGVGAAGSGLMTLKGRNDVEKKLKEKDNET
jgi:hypothetical protein